jgi:dTDP-glucose pyrophosphorylase
MQVIVPCCGKSTRFPHLRPKWMLNMSDGRLMVQAATQGLNIEARHTIIAILAEDEHKYRISAGLKNSFGQELQICVLDQPTRSQSHTVAAVLEQMQIQGPFLVKDSDNFFEVALPPAGNFICHDSLNHHQLINPSNKSYITLNQDQLVTRVVEKRVISDTFSVGGYGFDHAADFLEAFKTLGAMDAQGELYISQIINFMIAQGAVFKGLPVTGYQDWGTSEDWLRFKKSQKTYFVDLDGVVFLNAAEHFPPYWGQTAEIGPNVEVLLKLERLGNQLVFTTSRKEAYREKTTQDLQNLGFKTPTLVMNCLNGPRVLVNDYSHSNPYPSATAINVARNSATLGEHIAF